MFPILISKFFPRCHAMGLLSNYLPLVQGSSVFFFHQFPPSAQELFKVIITMNITILFVPPSFVTQMIQIIELTGDIQLFKNMKMIA